MPGGFSKRGFERSGFDFTDEVKTVRVTDWNLFPKVEGPPERRSGTSGQKTKSGSGRALNWTSKMSQNPPKPPKVKISPYSGKSRVAGPPKHPLFDPFFRSPIAQEPKVTPKGTSKTAPDRPGSLSKTDNLPKVIERTRRNRSLSKKIDEKPWFFEGGSSFQSPDLVTNGRFLDVDFDRQFY